MNRAAFAMPVVTLILFAAAASAHFQALLPSPAMVTEATRGPIRLELVFTHPMEAGPAMEMGRPKQFGVLTGGARQDLADRLQPVRVDGKAAFTATVPVGAPGDRVFFLEPAPYWEPAERKMIVHYTKTIVNAYGEESGWDALVGFPVEIEPLVRPYGLWTGNLFRGIVRRNGQPVPFAEVEVEYWNADRAVAIPADPFVTQVLRADVNGIFAYAMPRAGWWGFAALVEGEESMPNPAGEPVDVELGGLLWVHCVDMD